MTTSAPRIQDLCKLWCYIVPLLVMTLLLFINAVNLHTSSYYAYIGQQERGDSNRIFHDQVEQKNSDSIINPHPFGYVHLETDVCNPVKYANLFLLIVVHTAPNHFKQRQFIRDTWGHREKIYANFQSALVFMTGAFTGRNGTVQRTLDRESQRYRDIVQEDYHDSYKNLTYKVVQWLKWSKSYCNNTNMSYVLKVDDDMVVNMVNVYKFLRYRQKRQDRSTIYCMIWSNLTVHRDNESRWHLSKEDYVNDVYPDYCSGSGYILTRDLIAPMYNESFKTRFFWIDDIYITGIIAQRLNAKHHDLSGRYILSKKYLSEPFMQSYAMFAHLPGSNGLRQWFWQEMKKVKPYYSQTQDRYTNFGDAAIRL